MTPRRRVQLKAALLILTALLVGTLPLWTLKGVLYVLGGCVAAIGVVSMGMVLQLYVGFRRFESRVDGMARRVFGLERRAAARIPRVGFTGRDCR